MFQDRTEVMLNQRGPGLGLGPVLTLLVIYNEHQHVFVMCRAVYLKVSGPTAAYGIWIRLSGFETC